MINLTEEQFIEAVLHEKNHLKYRTIPKDAHFYKDLRVIETPDASFMGEVGANRVVSSYINKINPGAHLGKVISKFYDMEPLTDPSDSRELDPKNLMDDLIKYCEQLRKEEMVAVQDDSNGMILGVVSPNYVSIQNCDMFTISKQILDGAGIPYEASYEHDGYQMRINYRLPEMAIELPDVNGEENVMELRASLFNGMTGHRSFGFTLGSWEQICTNGAMGLKSKFEWRRAHVGRSVDFFQEFTNNFTQQLRQGEEYLDLLEMANEITEPIIKENEDIIKVLSSEKFKLQVSEAEEVYRRMRHHKRQYTRRTGFDLGRAVAEVARDTHSIDRRMDLEVIAGTMMLMQVVQ